MNWENGLRVFGGLRDFWWLEIFGRSKPKRFRKGFWRLGVFGGREFLGFLSLLNFKYKLWNW